MTEIFCEKTVFFTGHRNIRCDYHMLTEKTDEIIRRCIYQGYDTFIAGGAVGFDTLGACRIVVFKKQYPGIRLILALPCRDQTVRWYNQRDVNIYKYILGKADDIVYMRDFYENGCLHERNRWMVEHSSCCIAYFTGAQGGTSYTLDAAKKKGVKIINVALEGSERYE